MTLLPSSEFGIGGWEGNHYDVNPICAHPTCGEVSAHGHHMWARSFLRGQPQDWVRLPDGTILGNRIGLCVAHHNNVTGEVGGYKARLEWLTGVMWWVDRRDDDWDTLNRRMLDPQPPVSLTVRRVEDGAMIAHGHANADERKVCPVCGHHIAPSQPHAKQERRKAKQWVVTVPDDAEIGSEILDEWIDDFAVVMGAEGWTSRLRRYHVLVTVLAWASVNRSQFISDMAEAIEKRVA